MVKVIRSVLIGIGLYVILEKAIEYLKTFIRKRVNK